MPGKPMTCYLCGEPATRVESAFMPGYGYYHEVCPKPLQAESVMYPVALQIVRQAYENSKRTIIGDADEVEARSLAKLLAAPAEAYGQASRRSTLDFAAEKLRERADKYWRKNSVVWQELQDAVSELERNRN